MFLGSFRVFRGLGIRLKTLIPQNPETLNPYTPNLIHGRFRRATSPRWSLASSDLAATKERRNFGFVFKVLGVLGFSL